MNYDWIQDPEPRTGHSLGFKGDLRGTGKVCEMVRCVMSSDYGKLRLSTDLHSANGADYPGCYCVIR